MPTSHQFNALPNNEKEAIDQQDSSVAAAADATDASSSNSSGRVALLAGLVAVAALVLVASGGFGGLKDKVKDLEDLIAASGYLGPLIYAGAYAAATVLLFPASLLTLGAGYLFGPLKGTALVSASATLGASLAFLVSRYIARPAVEERLQSYPKFQAVYENISKDGAKLVLLLRLSPLVPFSLLNYGLGITKVGFPEYVAASWAGMLPGTFAYVYLGSLGKVAADAADTGAAGGFDGVKLALYVVGAGATIWATKLISSAASAAIEGTSAPEAGGSGPPSSNGKRSQQ
ncbi:hypothetical protein OEZ85_001881 [Tetradesmus obliquus]|uniref:VTT domain-containing protein n=1 Tax=Tetradesmus obliquus TaxID=3088 RepID=A0ABY8U410_TETOB|nr:hypothetical protein OEZ85_001881 [Tetradesmus obliquus]